MKITDKLDGGTTIALATAILYFGGYVYYDAYYHALGIPPELLKRTADDYVIASWEAIPLLLIVFLVLAMIKAIFMDQASARLSLWLRLKFFNHIPEFFYVMIWISMLAIAISSIENVGKSGQRDALKILSKPKIIYFNDQKVAYLGGTNDRIAFGIFDGDKITEKRICILSQTDILKIK